MAKHELHGQKLTPFEQGYMAFGKGQSLEMNPFDSEKSPHSRFQWQVGWDKAQRAAWGKSA